jgi:peptidoglycan hydrolase-like protein with peptidoglycan-binding domain
VFKLQTLLHREGKLDAEATGGPTGYWGNRDDAALRDLQKDSGLAVDGWVGPQGETIGHLRDLYRPPQAVQVSGAEMKGRETSLTVARDLAGQLGLDSDSIDLTNPAVLPALGAVNVLRYSTGSVREKEMQKLQDLRESDPKLAGRLQALAGEIATQPQWHYDKMTPQELEQARKALEEGDAYLSDKADKVQRYLPRMMRDILRGYGRPMQKIIVQDEHRRLDRELERRRDPRDR